MNLTKSCPKCSGVGTQSFQQGEVVFGPGNRVSVGPCSRCHGDKRVVDIDALSELGRILSWRELQYGERWRLPK